MQAGNQDIDNIMVPIWRGNYKLGWKLSVSVQVVILQYYYQYYSWSEDIFPIELFTWVNLLTWHGLVLGVHWILLYLCGFEVSEEQGYLKWGFVLREYVLFLLYVLTGFNGKNVIHLACNCFSLGAKNSSLVVCHLSQIILLFFLRRQTLHIVSR